MTTGESVLLDTNVVIDFFRGDAIVADKLLSHKIFLPSIVLGELYYGATLSSNRDLRFEQISLFANQCGIMAIDDITALHYGEMKAELKRKGTPIPENDIWIAALSKQHSLILATRDIHFKYTHSANVQFW